MHAKFQDNIWAANLAEMGLLSSKNGKVKYLLCAIDVFTRYLRVKSLTDKKTDIVLHGFIEIVNESKHQPNKLWVDLAGTFYSNLV